MQIETKHRILGVLVVIGLVVILLPFFQSGKELTPDATIAKAPAFPDQTIQVTSTDKVDFVNEQPDEVINVPHSEINTAKTDADKKIETITSENKTLTKIADKTPALKKLKTHIANHQRKNRDVKSQFESSLQSVVDDDGLAKINNAAWVIQIGSFKNKSNALRLVNQLRAKGYSAFIQQVSTTFGNSTRVFVGPEIKRTMAHALATRLEKDMHVQGVVISYQPLTLS